MPTPRAYEDPVAGAHAGARQPETTFVGREREMHALLRGLEEARGGHGHLFLLGGAPGIGKTKLADEFAARADAAGARVLWGRCWEAGGAPAYWPWIQALRGLVREADPELLRQRLGGGGPDLAHILPEVREQLPDLPERARTSSDVARFRLFDAVNEFLTRTSEVQPLVLTIEDLHGADEPSLLLLRFLSREISATKVVILATYRDVEVTREHPLAAALSETARSQGTTRLSLPGLNLREVSRFIAAITGNMPREQLVTTIYGETEGNPLFVGEVVRLLASENRLDAPLDELRWPLPEGVREVIGRRIERLPRDCRSLLAIGSVMGRDFPVEALERISGNTAEDLLRSLEEAIAAGVIGELRHTPGTFRFAHVLIRDTLYDDLTTADRVRLHRAVGEALETMYESAREPHLAELAYHFFEAAPGGDADKAVTYAVAAGKRAALLLAYEEAVRLLGMSLRALRQTPDERARCEVLLLLGDAQARSGDTPAAKETFLEAAGIATRIDVPDLVARAAFGYAGRFPWLRAGVDRRVIPLLKQALEALGSADSELRVLLLSRLAGALRDQPSIEARESLCAEAVAMARRIGDPETLAYALLAQWAATLLGPDGIDRQDDLAQELDRLNERIGDPERLMDSYWVRFIAFMTRGRLWDARSMRDLMERLGVELKQPSQRWYAGVITTVLALQDGRFDEAEQLIEETSQEGQRAQTWDSGAARLFALFILRREQGRLTELEDDLRRALADYPGYRSVPCMLVTLLCDAGRLEEARGLFDRLAAEDFAAFPKDNEWLFALTLLAETAAILGDRTRGETLYRQLAPYADLVGLAASEVSVGPVARPLGILAALLGRRDEAIAHLEDAVTRSLAMSARPWVAHSQYELARVLTLEGSREERARAHQVALSARKVAHEIGMLALERRVNELLERDLETRPRRRTAPGAPRAAALTARELEVAELVADGLSNRQIAERLYVSERTAETHVQNILMKLGFTSRAQVGGWIEREGLQGDDT